jgi:hypothetical protein
MATSIHIDISVFTDDGAYGKISGTIAVPVLPEIGDIIAFSKTYGVSEVVAGVGTLGVRSRIIPVGEQEVLIGLSDIKVETKTDAKEVMAAFEAAYGLFGEPWDEDDLNTKQEE